MYLLFRKKYDNTNTNDYNLNIGSERIKRVQHTKFLGLIIDEQLQWTAHIKHVKSKLSSSQLKTLYYSMVHPYNNIPYYSAYS